MMLLQQSYTTIVRTFFTDHGFSETTSMYLADFSILVLILLITILVYYITKLIINHFLRRLVQRSASKWDDHLYEQRVFTRLAMLLPAFILQVALTPTLSAYPDSIRVISIILKLYMVVIFLLVGSSFLTAIRHIYGEFEVANKRPITGYVQIGKIVLFMIGGIIIISIVIGQSPLTLLAGLGAMSAVTMLVFKGSILGFVAGLQLTSNDMMRIGDWITMPQNHTDGVVTDISLVTVKVRNFDNSVSFIPTYTLISDSFQNWRNMPESGGRRLKRSVLIDTNTIRFSDEKMISELKNQALWNDEWMQPGTRPTNLGLFRRFLSGYLKSHPQINKETTILVRQLQPGEFGMPLEIYAYYSPEELSGFEAFQSELMEYIFAIMPHFGLNAFQRPAGRDFSTQSLRES